MGIVKTLFTYSLVLSFNFVVIVNNNLILVKITVEGKTRPFPMLYGVLPRLSLDRAALKTWGNADQPLGCMISDLATSSP